MAFFGSILGIYAYNIVFSLSQVILAKIMGLYLIRFALFGTEWTKSSTKGKVEKHKGKFTFFPSLIYSKPQISKSEDTRYGFSCMAVTTVIVMIPCVIYLFICKGGLFARQNLFVTFIVFGAMYMTICMPVLTALKMGNKSNRHARDLYAASLDKLWHGSFADIEVYPDVANDPKVNTTYRVIHMNMCISKALYTRDFDRLHEYMRSLDTMLRGPGGYSTFVAYTGCYYHLIFYSSYINRNRENATKFYNIIKERLEPDKDANGRRVLAYYYLYVLNNVNRAKEYIAQAEEALESRNADMYTEGEFLLDQMYIDEIKTNIDKVENPAYVDLEQGNPLMDNTNNYTNV